MELIFRQPDDFHVHLRQGKLLEALIVYIARVFRRALVMPNLKPVIANGENALQYLAEIQMAAKAVGYSEFQPLMTIYLTPQTTPKMIIEAKRVGVIAAKLYPEGMTTGSESGVSNFKALYPVFQEMQDVGMVLCLHGESPDPSLICFEREAAFLFTFFDIVTTFPKLKVVFEHVSSAEAVSVIKSMPNNVAATITAHHLVMTFNDIAGKELNAHTYCLPVPKRPVDREEIIKAATSGDPHFFFGSDSAPHLRGTKECGSAKGGVFSAPVALPVLVEVFESRDALDKLEAFVSERGARFYELPLNEGKLTLVRKPWTVPQECGAVVPFMAGKELAWQVAL